VFEEDCLFCSIPKSPRLHTNFEDLPFAETPSFYAKPALGHFIEGYTLIVSKEHYRSFFSLERQKLAELKLFKEKLTLDLKSIYNSPVIAFEHGCVNPRKPAGSCIDHAHMHLVPFYTDVHEILKTQFSFELLENLTELPCCEFQEDSYIYYESSSGQSFVFKIDSPIPSQLLRRALCEALNEPDVWDWAIHPFSEKIQAFIGKYYQCR
jgi:diadenosine tetraphosphate (Ap4A) HIT family hydrolase